MGLKEKEENTGFADVLTKPKMKYPHALSHLVT
jgi:hypothetical protein